jgi:hypothetical protein
MVVKNAPPPVARRIPPRMPTTRRMPCKRRQESKAPQSAPVTNGTPIKSASQHIGNAPTVGVDRRCETDRPSGITALIPCYLPRAPRARGIVGSDEWLGTSRLFRVCAPTIEFAVEFDLREGGGHHEGTGPYHVGIDVQGMISSLAVVSEGLPDLLAANGVHARVVYDRGTIRVFLKDAAAPAAPLVKVLEANGVPLSFGAADGQAVFGFTAATGVTAEVNDVVVTRIECNEIPEVAMIEGRGRLRRPAHRQ